MKKMSLSVAVVFIIIFTASFFYVATKKMTKAHLPNNELKNIQMKDGVIVLPVPNLKGNVSVEEAIYQRRSERTFTDKPLSLENISQLLWAAQGITNEQGKRATPSAGATYPLDMYVFIIETPHVLTGIYKYHPQDNVLKIHLEGDIREPLASLAHNQNCLKEAQMIMFFTATIQRTAQRYGDRAQRYVFNEIGHASQNVYLQAVALNLGTVAVGAFDDANVNKLLNMNDEQSVLYMMPVGNILK